MYDARVDLYSNIKLLNYLKNIKFQQCGLLFMFTIVCTRYQPSILSNEGEVSAHRNIGSLYLGSNLRLSVGMSLCIFCHVPVRLTNSNSEMSLLN